MATQNRNRTRIVAPCVILASVVMTIEPAVAQTADESLAECRNVVDAAARLACYDRVVDRGAISAFGRSTPNVAMTVEEFGAEELTPPKPKKAKVKKGRAAQASQSASSLDEPLPGPIDTIRETVADLSVDRYGKTTVTLQTDKSGGNYLQTERSSSCRGRAQAW